MVEAESGDGVADLVEAFDDDRGDVAAFVECAQSRGAIRRGSEVFRILGCQTVIEI